MRKNLALSLLTMSILAAVPAMAAAPVMADGGAMTDAERSFLIDQMEASKKAFSQAFPA